MSGGKFSVVTQIPRLLNPFSSNSLANSSLADSPETSQDPEGLVTLPGADTDIQIKDIPIVTDVGGGETDMHFMKNITPAVTIPPRYLNSTCSSPDTSSLDTTCQTGVTRDFDHMYASLAQGSSSVLMAENVHLREMLVSQLDLIQQQAETILSKDKQLKQLKEENGLLVQRLSRMERRCRGDQVTASSSERTKPGVSQSGGGKKRTRDSDIGVHQDSVKKKKVETADTWTPEPSNNSNQELVDTLCNDELCDEIMGDMLSASRPDTPASVTSVDTVKSDSQPTAKSSKKTAKKQSLEGKRKSIGSSSSTSR